MLTCDYSRAHHFVVKSVLFRKLLLIFVLEITSFLSIAVQTQILFILGASSQPSLLNIFFVSIFTPSLKLSRWRPVCLDCPVLLCSNYLAASVFQIVIWWSISSVILKWTLHALLLQLHPWTCEFSALICSACTYYRGSQKLCDSFSLVFDISLAQYAYILLQPYFLGRFFFKFKPSTMLCKYIGQLHRICIAVGFYIQALASSDSDFQCRLQYGLSGAEKLLVKKVIAVLQKDCSSPSSCFFLSLLQPLKFRDYRGCITGVVIEKTLSHHSFLSFSSECIRKTLQFRIFEDGQDASNSTLWTLSFFSPSPPPFLISSSSVL